VRRRIDVEPDHVTQFIDDGGVVGQLELPHMMRLEPIGALDALDRRNADAGSAIAASVQLGVSAILWNLDATMLKPDCSTQSPVPTQRSYTSINRMSEHYELIVIATK
jgi:hypothetical protein